MNNLYVMTANGWAGYDLLLTLTTLITEPITMIAIIFAVCAIHTIRAKRRVRRGQKITRSEALRTVCVPSRIRAQSDIS